MDCNSAFLCVDDEIMILETLKEQLQRSFGEQYIYEMAENATEAWEIIDELYEAGIRLLVVVSDWLMPGIKGDEFLIQVHQKFPHIMTILLTGQADEEAIERSKQQAGLHACLRKPWQEAELVEMISHVLR
ncbi:MAG: response regulator [Cyanobacteria bacterium P01_D01_bin.115]